MNKNWKLSICRRLISSYFFSFVLYSFKYLISPDFLSYWIEAWFLIFPALIMYESVDNVYSKLPYYGEMQATINVRQFPPRDLFNSEVSLELRYGINDYFLSSLQ